jgi:hypothetical protein
VFCRGSTTGDAPGKDVRRGLRDEQANGSNRTPRKETLKKSDAVRKLHDSQSTEPAAFSQKSRSSSLIAGRFTAFPARLPGENHPATTGGCSSVNDDASDTAFRRGMALWTEHHAPTERLSMLIWRSHSKHQLIARRGCSAHAATTATTTTTSQGASQSDGRITTAD